MLKPRLLNQQLPSTAASNNLLSNQHAPLRTTTTRSNNEPMVTSFFRGSIQREQTRSVKRYQPILKKESKSNEGNSWVNTSDIESVIRKRIETDAQLSVQPSLTTQKYLLGPERICTQKMLPLPFQIREILKQKPQDVSNGEKLHLVYGYLTSINAIYYIVQEALYIFNVDELKNRTQNNLQVDTSKLKVCQPRVIRKNCKKIYQAQFPRYHSQKMIPSQFNGKVLIFEYSHEIEFCCYEIISKIQINYENENEKEKQKTQYKQRDFINLISLNLRIKLKTDSAEFITVTQKGQLLYLNQNGRVVCFQFSKRDKDQIKPITHHSGVWGKKAFISKNNSFMKKAKIYSQQNFDLPHSLLLSRKKNLALIYDDKTNRIYTLTARGDRTNFIQQIKKEIRVYEFLNIDNKVKLNCKMSISQEELLKQIYKRPQYLNTSLFTILKAESDYSRQYQIVALLSNGDKAYIQISEESLNIAWTSLSPDIVGIKKANKIRKFTLEEISKSYQFKDQNNQIQRVLSEQFQIPRSQSNEYQVRSYFNDRSLSIGLVKNKHQFSMYMTISKNMNNHNDYEVFPIRWNKGALFYDVQKFPTENQIFMVDGQSKKNLIECQISRLQKCQNEKRRKAEEQSKNLYPVTEKCHHLLRQVHHGPHNFVYLSNKFITNFTLLRPIDILHMMVVSKEEIFCEMYLPSILGLEPYQISCMLLQLYTTFKDTIYYHSKNYTKKINLLFEKLRSNTKKYQTLGDKSILLKISSTNQIRTGKKQTSEQKQDDQLQAILHKKEDFEKFKIKIRRLFISFSKLQLINNPNAFERIKLKFQTISTSSQIQDQIDKLNQEHKGQAKYCLLYISRVLYPFWRLKIGQSDVSRDTLLALKEKITQTSVIVDLLKMQSNQYWTHLNIFFKKLNQIIQMFIYVSQLPRDLTLEDALSKEPAYFQYYIFNTLRRDTSPQMLRIYIDKFPMYVSQQFEIMVKIFMEIRLTVNAEQIKYILGRLSQYPEYFLKFLKEQKEFMDLSFLKISGSTVKSPTVQELPDYTFQRLIDYFYSKVKSTSTDMQQKFSFLKQARRKMDSYKNPNSRKIQVFEPRIMQRLQRQYDELFKCLKLQQECRIQITKVAEELQERNMSDQQNKWQISKIIQKMSNFFKFVSSLEYPTQKRLPLETQTFNVNNSEVRNEELFRKISYYRLKREELFKLIIDIKSPKLEIWFISMFSQRGNNNAQKQHYKSTLYQRYCEIVTKARDKFNIHPQLSIKKQDFAKFINFVKREIKEIYLFLNMTKTPLAFAPLYRAIKNQMMKIENIIEFIIQNDDQYIFSVGYELVSLGYDKNIVYNHIVNENIKYILQNEYLQSQEGNQFAIQSCIYDWYMIFNMAKNFNRQGLDELYRITQKILQCKQQILIKKKKYQKFFQNGTDKIFNIINGKYENDMGRKTIMERLKNQFK